MIQDAWMSKKSKGDTVECLACSHHCKISPDKTGICGVRKNIDGTLKLLVYGRVSALNVDPIEKKPLFHFYPGTEIFSFGTVGCNFRCEFCQNWDLSQYHKTHDTSFIEKAGEELLPADAVNYCLENNIPSIAFTYNEPAIFFEYAYDTARLAKENGLNTVYVSNGFESREALEKIKPYLDAINVDLKAWSPEFYLKICGARIEPVKENIKWIWENEIWMEVTTLIITNKNDSEDELKSIAKFLAKISPDIPWHISRYHPAYKMDEPVTPAETLIKAYEIGKAAGLNYVYVGNIDLPGKENTYCPGCDELLISRTGYRIDLLGHICPKCKINLKGRFL